MDITGILISLFCVINAVSGQNVTITASAPPPATGAAANEVTRTATKTTSSVSVSKLDCAPPLNCPAVKCLFPVTPQGQCCPVCPSVENKPGKCPVPSGAGHCAEFCTGDSSCPGPLKCCSNGCGHDCMLPQIFIVKPGKCPVPTGPGLCAESCFGDASCPGAMKCCSNGCGKDCMMPKRNASSKPGKCPEPTGPGICILGCSSDWSCPDTQKCCSNGCGLLCTQPIGSVSSTPLCEGVFCPEVYCDDQFIPPGKCCNECPAPVPAY